MRRIIVATLTFAQRWSLNVPINRFELSPLIAQTPVSQETPMARVSTAHTDVGAKLDESLPSQREIVPDSPDLLARQL
jgi:hypothetical protein